MITEPRRFGYRADPPDTRDRARARRPGATRITERRMDLLVSRIRDQGATSSCVGHACVAGVELLYALQAQPVPRLSPAHAYWLARDQDDIADEDEGAHIRSCVRALRKVGCCGEGEWPLKRDTINVRPPMSAEMSGIRFADLRYERVQFGAEAVLDALQDGCPVVVGLQVGNVFVDHYGDDTIPAPSAREVMLGGHAVLACAFDRSGERIRIANSWSTTWGDQGFAWLEAAWFDRPTTGDAWALVPSTGANQ